MRLFELAQLTEAKNDTVVFTFGRFNPPTIGHQKLAEKVQAVAENLPNADHVVYLSQTQKPGKDPLSWKDKISLFKKMFPSVNVSTDTSIKNPYLALEALGKKYDNVIMVVGSDRVERFKGDMQKYLAEWGIKNFDVISAGERDPDAEGAEGMSASKARQLATDGNFEEFSKALPSTINNATKKVVYNKIRKNS
jgi:FAD synthase